MRVAVKSTAILGVIFLFVGIFLFMFANQQLQESQDIDSEFMRAIGDNQAQENYQNANLMRASGMGGIVLGGIMLLVGIFSGSNSSEGRSSNHGGNKTASEGWRSKDEDDSGVVDQEESLDAVSEPENVESKNDLNYCPSCGAELQGNPNYCSSCGKSL